MIRTLNADVAISKDGVISKSASFGGQSDVTTWRWDEVRRVSIGDGGRQLDRTMLAGLGLLGFLVRTRRAHVVLSPVDGADVVWQTKQPIHELRSEARRLLDDVPHAAGKVVLD